MFATTRCTVFPFTDFLPFGQSEQGQHATKKIYIQSLTLRLNFRPLQATLLQLTQQKCIPQHIRIVLVRERIPSYPITQATGVPPTYEDVFGPVAYNGEQWTQAFVNKETAGRFDILVDKRIQASTEMQVAVEPVTTAFYPMNRQGRSHHDLTLRKKRLGMTKWTTDTTVNHWGTGHIWLILTCDSPHEYFIEDHTGRMYYYDTVH